MITVKLYGLLRIESGISKKDLDGCVILVNGAGAKKQTKLHDGDLVVLMSPVAGG